MGLLKIIGFGIFWTYIACLTIVFWPNLRPYGTYSAYQFESPTTLFGNLAINERLNEAEKLFQGKIRGPEHLELHNGEIYTGLETGEIVKITKDKKLQTVIKISSYDEETKKYTIGRPIAIKFDKKGYMYATDAVFGILKIDVATKNIEVIVDVKEKIEGRYIGLANSLDITSDGDIYWSDVCADQHNGGLYLPILLANPCGRLIKYDQKTKSNKVLLRKLGLANGIALAKDESFVLIAECLLSRIVKYHLKGPRAGKHEILVEGLPGNPDNIQPDGRGGFLVALPIYSDDSEFWSFVHLLSPYPLVRKLIARLPFVLRTPFEYLNRLTYPTYDFTYVIQAINNFFDGFMVSPLSVVLRFDANGRVLDAAYCSNRAITGLSTALVVGNDLWLGSYNAPWMARIALKKALPSLFE